MQGYITPFGGGTFDASKIVSGNVTSGDLGDAVVNSGNVASGAITGAAGGGSFNIASGTLGTNDLGSGAIVSGLVASGQLGRYHRNSGTVVDLIACEMAISGIIAVAWGSGGCFVVAAQPASGLRLPAIGVVAGNFLSGAVVPIVRRGWVTSTNSGVIASGFPGQNLFVGSGGLIVNQSGFMAGASSGAGPGGCAFASGLSGALVQRIGVAVSGGIDVRVGEVTSGLLSGLLGAY